MPDLSLILLLLCMGAISGVLAGMLGIGGGLLLVPLFTFILHQQGVPEAHVVHASIATALAVILFTSFSSLMAHHRAGAVRWVIVRFITPGLLIGGMLGSRLATYLPTKQLALVFGVFVIFSAYQMFMNKKPKPSRQIPGKLGLTGAGTVIGSASAMVGAGGGFLSVPFFVWSNVPVRNAVATSAAMGFPIALFSCLGYIVNGWHLQGMPSGFLGFIYLPGVAGVSVMSMMTAPMGAKLAHTLPVTQIKRIFAIMLTGIAMSMIYKAVTGF